MTLQDIYGMVGEITRSVSEPVGNSTDLAMALGMGRA